MKIALIYNLNRGLHDYEAEFDSPLTIKAIIKAISPRHQVKLIEADADYPDWIKTLMNYKPELIFNIAEGYNGSCREAFYAALIEQLNFKYSGPDAINLAILQNKFLTKELANLQGVPIPKGVIVDNIDDLKLFKNIKFPVIIKLNAEGSSLSINKDSIVNNKKSLFIKAKGILEKFRKSIIIEEYIEGIDVSMSYVEGLGILGPAKIFYPEKEIYDWNLKTDGDKNVIIKTGANLPKSISGKLRLYSKILVNHLDINGYAKIDYRINKNKIYLLEINGQISLHPKGEFIIACRANGYTFKQIINHIIDYASRHKKHSKGLNNFNI